MAKSHFLPCIACNFTGTVHRLYGCKSSAPNNKSTPVFTVIWHYYRFFFYQAAYK